MTRATQESTPTTATPPALTLQDVADLAGVRRPVVSMWRTRTTVRGQTLPFPAAVDSTGGIERFRRDEIVDWLRRTGRGNNPEAHLDAPALSAPSGARLDELVTLLCLRVLGGEELAETSQRQRQQLSRDLDPRDRFLRSEIATATPDAETLQFIDELLEASFGGPDALARLERGRLARQLAARDLTAEALELMRTLATACAAHMNPEGVPLLHGGGTHTVTLALAEAFRELSLPGRGQTDRAVWRRAAIVGIGVSDEAPSPCVRLTSVLGSDAPTTLNTLDGAVLDLAREDLAVVLGPAKLLCDALGGEQERTRAETLRPGNLAMAVRLPRGMWREAHRQALGVWICARSVPGRRPFVADLSALHPHELEHDDLAADVATALAGAGGRACRYLRPNELESIMAGHEPVPRGTRATRLSTKEPATHLERIRARALLTAEPSDGFDVLVSAAPGALLLRTRSLGELAESGHIRVKRGSRIDPEHADAAGSVAVRTGHGSMDQLGLDPFDAARLYPRATRTEPGDVVFTEKPRPQATVDAHGGSLVASPSRLLRPAPEAGIGAHTLAAIINRQPEQAREWKTWQVPMLPAAEVDALEAELVRAGEHEAALRRRWQALRELQDALIDGVTAGAVTIETT